MRTPFPVAPLDRSSSSASPASGDALLDDAPSERFPRLDGTGLCRAVLEAIDPRWTTAQRWDAVRAAVEPLDTKLATGLCRWGAETSTFRPYDPATSPEEIAWTTLGALLGDPGTVGIEARERFAQTFGRLTLDRVQALVPDRHQTAWQRRGVLTGQAWCQGMLYLLERIGSSVARELAQPIGEDLLRYWAALPRRNANYQWSASHHLQRTAAALNTLDATTVDAIRTAAFAAVDATPPEAQALWSTYASLHKCFDHGRLAVVFGSAVHERLNGRPPSPSDWSAGLGRGTESEARAQRLREWGLLDLDLGERLTQLKGLDPRVRATLEARVLRHTLDGEGTAGTAPGPNGTTALGATAGGRRRL